MIVTSAKYTPDFMGQPTNTVVATIDDVEMFVPINAEDNRHWIAIQKWVAEGNTIAEAD